MKSAHGVLTKNTPIFEKHKLLKRITTRLKTKPPCFVFLKEVGKKTSTQQAVFSETNGNEENRD